MRSSIILSIAAFFALSSAAPTPDVEARGCTTGQNGCNTADITFLAAGGNSLNVNITIGEPFEIFTYPGGGLSWSQIRSNEPLRNLDVISRCHLTAQEAGTKDPVIAGPVGLTDCEACNPLYDIGPPQTIASILCESGY